MKIKRYITLLVLVQINIQVYAQVVNKNGQQVLENVQNTLDVNKPISTATQTALDLKTTIASPTFTGTPTLPTGTIGITQAGGDNSTAIATTAFVTSAVNQNYTATIVNSDQNILSNTSDLYVIDVSAAAVSLTLPAITASPNKGIITISDYKGNASTNNITIIPNGSDKIFGASSYIINSDYTTITLMAIPDQGVWIIKYELPAGGTEGQVIQIVNGVPVWEDTAAPVNTYYLDADADGFGDSTNSIIATTVPYAYVSDNTDCDDTDSAINTAATEICDGIDNNCDGSIDEGFSFDTYYIDADNDGYGSISNSGALYCLNPGVGYSLTNDDCDDADAAINPTLPDFIYYIDFDGDGYGDVNDLEGTVFCLNPGGYSKTNDDCDDTDSVINPGRAEIGGNSVDENCDGNIYVVGDYVAGGVVIYIAPTPTDLNGDGFENFGLVCSIDDLSTGIRWSSDLRDTNALGENVGTGKNNTDIITGIYGNNTTYAAGLAIAYTGGGYSDWFLPSKTAVKWMYNNKDIIETTALLNGGSAFAPTSNGYWSSSEFSYSFAWRVKWSNGNYGTNGKVVTLHAVRAVRAF